MPESNQTNFQTGLVSCFTDFEGTYCVRKLVEMITSILFLIATLIIFSIFIYKYHVAKPYWMISILTFLTLTLITNILFCFYNTLYWLYALENYFFNMYYLMLVSYICSAYVLKNRSQESSKKPLQRLQIKLNQQNNKTITQTVVFYCTVGLFIAVYLAIFIASLISEIQNDNQQYQGSNSTINYCQEVWYLVLNVICIALSIVVVIIMLKSQKQQYTKILEYSEKDKGDDNITSSDYDQTSFKNLSNKSLPSKQLSVSLLGKNVYNPFKNLWIWVGLNVISQIFNIIESGLYIEAIPPQCLIVQSNPGQSNLISLFFDFITLYLGFAATLWYISLVKLVQQKTVIDRSIFFSQELRAEGNIELFVPSKEETVTFI